MTKLFNLKNEIPPRPGERSDEVYQKAFHLIDARLREASDQGSGYEAREDEVRAMFTDYDRDGYHLASMLESQFGWSVNADVVAILDCIDGNIEVCINELHREWFALSIVQEHFAKFKKGVIVSFHSTQINQVVTGEITLIYDTGRATVLCEALGHKKGSGMLGVSFNLEDLTIVVVGLSMIGEL